MADEDVNRTGPQTWREYLRDSKESWRVGRWIWDAMTTPVTVRLTKTLVAFMTLTTVCDMALPFIVTLATNAVTGRNNWHLVLTVLLPAYLVLLLISRIGRHRQGKARESLQGLSWGALDEHITKSLFGKSMGQILQEGSVFHVSNIDKGRWKAIDLYNTIVNDGIPTLMMLSVSYVFLWFLSPVGGLIMTGTIISYVVWMLYLSQRVIRVCAPIEKDLRFLNRRRVERWEKIERVTTSAQKDTEQEELRTDFNAAIAQSTSFWADWYMIRADIRELINSFGVILCLIWGFYLVWRDGPGVVGILWSLYWWSKTISDHLWRVGHIEREFNWYMPTVRNLMQAMQIVPDVMERTDAIELGQNIPISITFEGVSHAYNNGSSDSPDGATKGEHTLRNVSFSINIGERVALIGPSGVGKTTIMRLLLRYNDPDHGRILINGHDLRDLRLASFMRNIGYIPQSPQVLDGTIRYNLWYSLTPKERESMSDDDLWELMRLLQIDFGSRLTDGLETLVGRNGVRLSGGQAQRLMIGAAAIKRPSLMIIDEATSSLDSTTEKAVQRGLEHIMQGDVGALIIAHRLSTVRNLCNKFIILKSATDIGVDESQVEAIGSSFEELYDISPTFRRLADDQDLVITM